MRSVILPLISACIAYLTATTTAAKIIRSSDAFGCESLASYGIFLQFLRSKDILSAKNAIKNGECILIPYGQDVDVVKSMFTHLLVRLPGDSRVWWVSLSDFVSAIEREKFIRESEREIRRIEKDRQRSKRWAASKECQSKD